jgi:plastocyanin
VGARGRAIAALGLAGGSAAAALAGCFSEREVTAPAPAGETVCGLPVREGVAGSTVVVVRRFAFGPTEVRVRAGERVTWVNCEIEGHTSTADGGEWDSPLLALGAVFTRTFPAAGVFPYHCALHPFMTGRVVVE